MMVGRSVSFKTEGPSTGKMSSLSIENLVVNENRGVPAVKNLQWNFVLVKLSGLQGLTNGQSELIQGHRSTKVKSVQSRLRRCGTSSTSNHRNEGRARPEDRHRDGLVLI